MHIKSILNRVEPLKSFVYREQRLVEVPGRQPFLGVDVEPRANGRRISSGCGRKQPGYDKLAAKRFEFVLACLGNPDPVDMKSYCPEGKETFNDEETTEEAPPRRDCREATRR